MHRRVAQVFSVLLLVNSVTSSAIPIWEMLTYEEKMGRLMYLFVHLVQRYCKTQPSADCRKIMTLHGISNLLNYDEHTLDLLDPDQRNASELVWQAATKSRYKFPPEKNYDLEKGSVKSSEDYELNNSDSNDEPQRVVVPAPYPFNRRISELNNSDRNDEPQRVVVPAPYPFKRRISDYELNNSDSNDDLRRVVVPAPYPFYRRLL